MDRPEVLLPPLDRPEVLPPRVDRPEVLPPPVDRPGVLPSPMDRPGVLPPPGFVDEDEDIVFPPLKRKRAGRPINSTKTNAIGLTTSVKPFEKKSKLQQQNTVFNMLLKSPLKGKRRRLGDKYDIDDIKDLTGISSATINDEIDVGLIFPKLTEGARQKVGSSVSTLKALGVFYCPVCREKVDEAEDMTDGGGRESLM